MNPRIWLQLGLRAKCVTVSSAVAETRGIGGRDFILSLPHNLGKKQQKKFTETGNEIAAVLGSSRELSATDELFTQASIQLQEKQERTFWVVVALNKHHPHTDYVPC